MFKSQSLWQTSLRLKVKTLGKNFLKHHILSPYSTQHTPAFFLQKKKRIFKKLATSDPESSKSWPPKQQQQQRHSYSLVTSSARRSFSPYYIVFPRHKIGKEFRADVRRPRDNRN